MKTKMILSMLTFAACVFFVSCICAQPYEVPLKTGINTDKGIEYIGVDKNRIVNAGDSKQQQNYKNYTINPSDKSRYEIDIENWVEPQEPTRALSPRHEDIEFGRGMGVDMDLVRDSDAFSCKGGAIDAREAQYIREDTD